MGIVTEPGFHDGKFLKAGQFARPEKEEVETGVGKSEPSVDLDAMSKDELLAEAKKRGVDVKASDSKGDILAALKA